jgi:hypothetical protein
MMRKGFGNDAHKGLSYNKQDHTLQTLGLAHE